MLEPDTRRCASEETVPREVDTRWCASKDIGPQRGVDLVVIPHRLGKETSTRKDAGP